MKVLLQRGLFLGGHYYDRSPFGTEVLDTIGGKAVVFYNKDKAHNPETEVVLPKDAVPYTTPGERKATDLLHNAKVEPSALGEIGRRQSRSFVEHVTNNKP